MTYREELTPVGELLTLALRGGRSGREDARLLRLFTEIGIDPARHAAVRNQVESFVGHEVGGAGAEIGGEWRLRVCLNAARVERLIETAGEVSAALASAGIASAAIEGGGVLLGTGLSAKSYCPGDVDLLVDKCHWSDVPRVLGGRLGFRPADRRGRPTSRIEFMRERCGRSEWIEIGCEPFDRTWVPLDIEDRSAEWLTRRIRSAKHQDIAVLAPTDALTQVCIHTSLHSFIRAPGIRLHVDVDRLVRDTAIDWRAFLDEVRACRADRRAFVSLAIAAGLLGTPIPCDVLRALAPPRMHVRAIFGLLSAEGAVSDGRPKLGRWRTVLLDALLQAHEPAAWLRQVFLPPEEWMRTRFDPDSTRAPVWLLHARRMRALLTCWRPQ